MMTSSVPAAQYLRMSTEHQQYSIDNQAAAIAKYAEDHGFAVVKTYTDPARSGVSLKGRVGLRQLLNDVVSGRTEFRAILVYDVSRWGRFQDADEAAHYEFLCKSAGIPVIYCAELFMNDATMPGIVMKALKRAMAGEYSRELSEKVYAGLKRLASLGFKQGGEAGYGLRRMLVSRQREPKQILEKGERKSIANDRVILVPGPPDEVAVVREIYRMFLHEHLSMSAIARHLNEAGIRSVGGRAWKTQAVIAILTHPKYTGFNVFGRTSYRLKTLVVHLPKAQWQLADVYEPIIDRSTFIQVQQILFCQTHNKTNERLLDDLRLLLRKRGRLSLKLLEEAPDMASPTTYATRFGSICRAYELIGYGQPEDFASAAEVHRRTLALRRELLCRLEAMSPTKVTIVSLGLRKRTALKVGGRTTVSVIVCRYVSRLGTKKFAGWDVYAPLDERRFMTLVARLNKGNTAICDLYLLSRIDVGRKKRFTCRIDNNSWLKSGAPLANLSEFCDVVEKMRLQRTRTYR